MPIRLLQDMECSGKTVVIRQDLNVPMKDGRISNDKRIRAALPGIRMALDKGAGVILLSHLGRPTEGVVEEKFSLAPVAAHLSGLLGLPVKLAADLADAKAAPGEVVLLENIRFFKGEKKNDPGLAARLAALGDIYVMDAFGAAHRAHSSTEGAVRAAKVACAGPLMAAELDAFAKVLDAPARPLMAIIGGSKVSTKLGLLDNLLGKVDTLIVGGGIANTFLAAAGSAWALPCTNPSWWTTPKRSWPRPRNWARPCPCPWTWSRPGNWPPARPPRSATWARCPLTR